MCVFIWWKDIFFSCVGEAVDGVGVVFLSLPISRAREQRKMRGEKNQKLTGVHRQDVRELHQGAVGELPVGVELATLERGLEDVEGRDLKREGWEEREREREKKGEMRLMSR